MRVCVSSLLIAMRRLHDAHKHAEFERGGDRAVVATETTYSRLPHPIVVACAVIGFERKEGGREVEVEPLVKRRVNELSLLSRIWPLNKSAVFALTPVCPFAT